jgi:hypothetical protein
MPIAAPAPTRRRLKERPGAGVEYVDISADTTDPNRAMSCQFHKLTSPLETRLPASTRLSSSSNRARFPS